MKAKKTGKTHIASADDLSKHVTKSIKNSTSDEKFIEFLEEKFGDKSDSLETVSIKKTALGYTLTGDPDFDMCLEACFEILGVKGNDYTVGSKDRLFNFRRVAEFTGLTMEQVWSVYFAKHIFAVFNYVKSGGKSESEPIEGRLNDVINYTLLMYKIVQEREREKQKSMSDCDCSCSPCKHTGDR